MAESGNLRAATLERPAATADGHLDGLPPRPVINEGDDSERARSRRKGRESKHAGILHGYVARTGGLLAAIVVLFLVAATSLAIGAKAIDLGDTIRALLGAGGGDEALIIDLLRVPRTVIGLAIGGALGAAGALIQGMTRNPLADPWILGIQAGAALAVVIGIYAFSVGGVDLAWFALLGAGVTWLVVYSIGSTGGARATPLNLTLAGAAMAALLAALTSAIVVFDSETLDEYRFWVAGSIARDDLRPLIDMAPFLVLGGVIALLCGRALNGLSLGHDVARALGQNIALTQGLVATSVVLLAGAAVAVAGPIGFVGLTVPHLARALVGPDYRWIIPYSAIFGATLLLIADIIGRVVVSGELQVGIVMAFIGAPAFIVLVRRRRLASI